LAVDQAVDQVAVAMRQVVAVGEQLLQEAILPAINNLGWAVKELQIQ
jgi:hypothetical protein